LPARIKEYSSWPADELLVIFKTNGLVPIVAHAIKAGQKLARIAVPLNLKMCSLNFPPNKNL
jgi:hypothetical protein